MTLPEQTNDNQSKTLRSYERVINSSFTGALAVAKEARSKGYDPTEIVETKIIKSSYDRFSEQAFFPPEIIEKLSDGQGNYEFALKSSINYLKGKYSFVEPPIKLANNALKIGLLILTRAKSNASLNSIRFSIKRNQSGTNSLVVNFDHAIYFLNPKQIAFSLIIGEEARKALGLNKATQSNYNKETIDHLFKEIHVMRSTANLQMATNEKDLLTIIQNLPIELDSASSIVPRIQKYDNLKQTKISLAKVELVKILNDIIPTQSSFIVKLAHMINIDDWDWLKSLTRPSKNDNSLYETKLVLCRPTEGSFRLVYGRAQNTSNDTVGVHPSTFELFNNILVPGSLVDITYFGHFTVASVDSIEPPIIKLDSGDVIIARDPRAVRQLRGRITKIIWCGDILVSPTRLIGNKTLPSPGYDMHQWLLEAATQLDAKKETIEPTTYDYIRSKLQDLKTKNETELPLDEAIHISSILNIPLFPKYLLNWELLTVSDVEKLRKFLPAKLEQKNAELVLPNTNEFQAILERLGVEYSNKEQKLILNQAYFRILSLFLSEPKSTSPTASFSGTLDYIQQLSNQKVVRKTGSMVGLNIIRQITTEHEVARPAAHLLFPVDVKRGNSRDVLAYCRSSPEATMVLRWCNKCMKLSPYLACPFCNAKTQQYFYCTICKKYTDAEICETCRSNTIPYYVTRFEWQNILEHAIQKTQVQPYAPLQGIFKTKHSSLYVERLEKGILRQRNNLHTSKDGTIKFLVNNAPLTIFSSKQASTNMAELKKMGYDSDIYGNPLKDENQLMYLKYQDLILPFAVADQLRKVADYVDEMLVKLYGIPSFYNVKTLNDLVGKLVVGQSQTSTFGVIGRIIGFSEANVCFAHPIWHSTKLSNCRGNADYISLLLDTLLNYSSYYVNTEGTDQNGTPSAIQIIVNRFDPLPRSVMMDLHFEYTNEFYRSINNSVPIKNIDTGTTAWFNHQADYVQPTTLTETIVGIQNTSTLKSLKPLNLIDIQLKIADISASLEKEEIAKQLLTQKLIPLFFDSLNHYTTQKFRCKNCGEVYRRPNLRGICLSCEKKLQPTYMPDDLQNHINMMERIISNTKIDSATQATIRLAKENVELLLYGKKQTTLSDYG